jgi:hypothetical protein
MSSWVSALPTLLPRLSSPGRRRWEPDDRPPLRANLAPSKSLALNTMYNYERRGQTLAGIGHLLVGRTTCSGAEI